MKIYTLSHNGHEIIKTQFYETISEPLIKRWGSIEEAAKNGWIIKEED